MVNGSDEIRRMLSKEDEEFRSWSKQHQRYEDKLNELAAKAALSPDEEIEEKVLKKKKLQLKDLMAEKIRGHEMAHHA